jgi:hypothetical protein
MALAPASSSARIDLRLSLSSKATTSGGELSSMRPQYYTGPARETAPIYRSLDTAFSTLKKSATPQLCPPQEGEISGTIPKKD